MRVLAIYVRKTKSSCCFGGPICNLTCAVLAELNFGHIKFHQIEESDEAQKKFANAKSISSSQFFGEDKAVDADSQVRLQKFAVYFTVHFHHLSISSNALFCFWFFLVPVELILHFYYLSISRLI